MRLGALFPHANGGPKRKSIFALVILIPLLLPPWFSPSLAALITQESEVLRSLHRHRVKGPQAYRELARAHNACLTQPAQKCGNGAATQKCAISFR
jgi:hypothetical protein